MKTNKILALVLAVWMLLSVAPLSVFAANLPTIPSVEVSGGDGEITVKRGTVTYPADKDVYYYNILYSTDKTNWLLAATMPRDSVLRTVREPEEGTFVAGTTYHFAVQAVSWSNETGPLSPTASIKYTDSKGALRAEWEAVMAGYHARTVEKSANYNKVNLVKGEKIVWSNGLYTLTVQVAAVSSAQAKLKITMKNKTGCTFECHYLGWDGVPGKSAGSSFSIHNGSKTVKVNFADLTDGANHFTFNVTGYGNPVSQYRDVATGNEYNEYADKLIYLGRKHTMYFQKAPAAASLTFSGQKLNVTSKAISFGAAYKSTSKAAKASGSILYYKAANAKKWSKKTFAGGKPFVLNNLQANTVYQLRSVNFVKSVSAADNKTVITSLSGYSNILQVRTGLAAAPQIKSVKVTSKVVKVHHDAEWWYNGVKWIYKEAYDSTQTNFTVKVTLKSAPKGMVALQCSNLGALNTQIKDGTGTTFTFTGTRGGNAKGKTTTISFLSYTNKFDNSWYAGTSPAVKKSITL